MSAEPTSIELVPLDAEARSSLSALAYREWFQACDILKTVKSERNDGSQNWLLSHSERLITATADLAKTTRILDQINAWSPLILGR